jgi:hypothetical protein
MANDICDLRLSRLDGEQYDYFRPYPFPNPNPSPLDNYGNGNGCDIFCQPTPQPFPNPNPKPYPQPSPQPIPGGTGGGYGGQQRVIVNTQPKPPPSPQGFIIPPNLHSFWNGYWQPILLIWACDPNSQASMINCPINPPDNDMPTKKICSVTITLIRPGGIYYYFTVYSGADAYKYTLQLKPFGKLLYHYNYC